MPRNPGAKSLAAKQRAQWLRSVPDVVIVTALTVSVLAVVAVFALAGVSGVVSNSTYTFYVSAAMVASVLLGATLFAPRKHRSSIAVLVVSIAAGLGVVEWYLSRPSVINPLTGIARAHGVQFDPRMPSEVVADARVRGENLKLAVFPEMFFDRPAIFEGVPIIPFGAPANSKIALCNESGEYLLPETDEAGFFNPRGAWNGQAAEVLLIGDSFTAGWCVPVGQSFADVVRASYPRTVNLGRGGSGPLVELGILKEYLGHFRPRFVVWNFFENDYKNVVREWRVPILQRYLDDQFSQNLLARRELVNAAVNRRSEEVFESLRDRSRLPLKGIRHFLNFYVPTWLSQMRGQTEGALPTDADWILKEVLAAAHRSVEAVGARLIFVYLADYSQFGDAEVQARSEAIRAAALSTAASVGLSTLDTTVAVRSAFSDPRAMHNLSGTGHYNPTGHRLIGELITTHLRQHTSSM